MARKTNKSPKNRGFGVYFGIIVCVFVVVCAIFLNYKNHAQDTIVNKIDKFLVEKRSQNLTKKAQQVKTQENSTKKIADLNLTKNTKILPAVKKVVDKSEDNLTRISDINSTKLITIDKNFTKIKKDQNLSKQSQLRSKKTQIKISQKFQNSSKKLIKVSKPKLVIILDDIANFEQARDILSLKMKITPSIFPPNKSHPHTPEISKMFDFYMVHLPLEAIKHTRPEPDTLKINSSKAEISSRIDYIVKKFNNLKYINNHTGSKFTSDFRATKNLLEVLKAHKINFLDSLTTPNSKVKSVSDELELFYIRRDVFIDNIQDVDYILNQIKSGVKISQKDGWAIIIGHPHSQTLKALKIAKNSILKDIDILYLKELYELLNRATK